MAIDMLSPSRPGLFGVAAAAAAAALCIIITLAAAPRSALAAGGGATPATSSLPSLARACDAMSKDMTVIYYTCKGLGRAPETLVKACDELAREPDAFAAGEALGEAFAAIADGRALSVPIRDLDAWRHT